MNKNVKSFDFGLGLTELKPEYLESIKNGFGNCGRPDEEGKKTIEKEFEPQ